MRVTSDFFVSALMRRVFSAGSFAAVLNRGAAEAGAIFLIARDRAGDLRLYGPAAQTDYGSGKPDDRLFSLMLHGSDSEVEARLDKERRFDSDIWVVEIEADLPELEKLVTITTP